MTMKELRAIFKKAKRDKLDVCVGVMVPGQEDIEYIVNKNRSIDNKLEYYEETYTSELNHRKNPMIRIVKAFALDFYMGGE